MPYEERDKLRGRDRGYRDIKIRRPRLEKDVADFMAVANKLMVESPAEDKIDLQIQIDRFTAKVRLSLGI